MPHQQRHRGLQSKDLEHFNEDAVLKLHEASKDAIYLLNRGYTEGSLLKLIGDRYRLHQRQRQALMRTLCTDKDKIHRSQKHQSPTLLKDKTVGIDAYNLLITTESALSGGIILLCRDGCYRDLASVHSTYRKVSETLPAIALIGSVIASLEIKRTEWFLDSPISNSGKLRKLLLEEAEKNNWNWDASLVHNPDKELVAHQEVVFSSDSWVIDHAQSWSNFQALLIENYIKPKNIIKIV